MSVSIKASGTCNFSPFPKQEEHSQLYINATGLVLTGVVIWCLSLIEQWQEMQQIPIRHLQIAAAGANSQLISMLNAVLVSLQ